MLRVFFLTEIIIGHFEPMFRHFFFGREERIQAFQRTLRRANGAVEEMEIACRGSEMRVPQQSLDHEQVHAFIQKMGRESVA